MKYRNEVKYIISKNQAEILKQRLKLVMNLDTNTQDSNTYLIRSLYFDDIDSSSYYEKLDGILYRKKYRIRIYNGEDKFIRLECKYKHNNMTAKEQVKIDRKTCDKIVNGDYDIKTDNELLKKFINDMKTSHVMPSVIVDYERVAFTYPISTTRITFDFNIKSGNYNYNLYDNDVAFIPVIDNDKVVLEVKFDEVLPSHLATILQTIPSYRQAVSKFALCREVK